MTDTILYHGTAGSNAASILSGGLRPRYKREGNWAYNNSESHPKLVYMTTLFHLAEYHAMHAAAIKGDDEVIMCSIPLSNLKASRLRPDENFLDSKLQNERGTVSLAERASSLSRLLDDRRWKASLSRVCAIAHVGPVKNVKFERMKVKDNGFYREHLWEPKSEFERKKAWDHTHKTYVALQAYFYKQGLTFLNYDLWQAMTLDDINRGEIYPEDYRHLAVSINDPRIQEKNFE